MINLFFGIGNLTRDPDLRYTPQGTPVCKFSIAINRKYNDKEDTTFLMLLLCRTKIQFVLELSQIQEIQRRMFFLLG